MDVQQNLRNNEILNQFKAKLKELKSVKGKLDSTYNDKSTSFLQKNEKFFQIMQEQLLLNINQYRSQLDEVQRIIDEELNNVNAPNIPEQLIEQVLNFAISNNVLDQFQKFIKTNRRIDQEQSVKDYMQERKEQVRQLIQQQEEKQKHLKSLTTQFENSLIDNKILPEV